MVIPRFYKFVYYLIIKIIIQWIVQVHNILQSVHIISFYSNGFLKTEIQKFLLYAFTYNDLIMHALIKFAKSDTIKP